MKVAPNSRTGELDLDRPDLIETRALLGGRWLPAGSLATFDVHDPASGQRVSAVADCGVAEALDAVQAAVDAGRAWREAPAAERRGLLKAWGRALERHGEDIARLISLEVGKPLVEGRDEVAYAAAYIDWFADEAIRSVDEILASPNRARTMLVRREPVGVVAAVTPWNFPLAMLARKAAPALAAGCTVVARPSECTPLTALALGRLAMEAGLPAGALNIVPSAREGAAAIADAWLGHSAVRKLSFTGSTAVGKHLATLAGAGVKRLSLELGGNAPFIVFEDADLNVAVDCALKAKIRNAGQACIAPNRFLVQASIHQAFAARLLEAVKQIRVGPATDMRSAVGPLINDRAARRVGALVQDAIDDGAELLGAAWAPPASPFVAPAILTRITPSMRIAQEEIFAPVFALQAFVDEAEAVDLANATPTGLAAYVFTQDEARADRMAAAMEAGMVGVNETALSSEVAPFGGVKESGYGREGSRHGLAEYQSLKYVCRRAPSACGPVT
jgi:succinate-semialdehyde dehydrogenase/glutarate-semialdehyde dehydrogenase